jgi:hypothetical protein
MRSKKPLSYNQRMKLALGILTLTFCCVSSWSQDLDIDLADALKIEANHNSQRIKSFKVEATNNKVFDEEREKGFAEFLEEQEKWDLLRDRGLQEQRRLKRANISPVEGSPEHLEYLEEKESQEARYERSRKLHVTTREKVLSQFNDNVAHLETEELGLLNTRPRYELRKRGENKWAKSGPGGRGSSSSGGFGNTGGGSSGGFEPAPISDFVPSPEFPPAPPPFEVTDESQFTPPPAFDPSTGMPLDGMGEELNIPPPPPPPEFDF